MRPGALFVGVALAVLGCAGGGIDRASFPDAPMAFVYRTETQAHERLEILERAEGRRSASRPGEMRARLEDVGQWFGLGNSPEQQQAALKGRLAFFDLRTDEIDVADFALPGARPLDWSPDHQKLLYVSAQGGSPQIYEWDRATRSARALTRGPAAHPSASYGPGGRIAYVEVRGGGRRATSRVWVTGPGGAAPRVLTPGPVDGAPAWSPDGKVLVYEVAPHLPSARLAAIDPDGGEPRLVARGRRPVFTPDGAWVVYSARVSGGWRLRRMRPDGSGKLAFGQGPGDAHTPSVSPDGRFVVYVHEEGKRQRLRVRGLDGSGDRPLLNHGDGHAPAWN